MIFPIDGVVQVNISQAQAGSAGLNTRCNVGLIIGTSDVISAEKRIEEVHSLAEVLALGFEDDDPEYLAAGMYFGQNPAPKSLMIGRRHLHGTAGDEETPETVQVAFDACRAKSDVWFGIYDADAADANVIALAAKADASKDCIVFFESDNTDCLVAEPVSPDIFKALGTAKAKNAMGIYTGTAYAGAALMGLMMAMESGEDGSAFSANHSILVDVDESGVTSAQLAILQAKNGNAYIRRGQSFTLLEKGVCVDGVPYDDKMYLAMTKRVIQDRLLSALAGNKVRIPQTEGGVAMLVAAITAACEKMKDIGFVAPGIWTGADIQDLKTGDALTLGYRIFASAVASQSQADREARKAPPVRVALKTSGSIETIVIGVDVNQ